MIEPNNPNIDVDALMALVRQEAARRDPLPPLKEPARELFSLASREAAFNQIGSPANLEIDELLGLDDEEFIEAAYRKILGRSPDARGQKLYLEKLWRGERTKIDILGGIRYSREGRRRGVRVRGLLRHWLPRLAYRVTLLGYLLEAGVALFRLPVLKRNVREIQSRQDRSEATWNDLRSAIGRSEGAMADQGKRLDDATRGLLTLRRDVILQQRRVGILLEEVRRITAGDGRGARNESLDEQAQELLDGLYIDFEDQFRGSPAEVRKKLEVYLPVIRGCVAGEPAAPVLDLGAGRGEWLELLRDGGLTARGVDRNSVLVAEGRERGLSVEKADALAYLRQQPGGSLGAVTAFHVVEHLSFEAVVALLDEALRVLKPGGALILETPNPGNLLVGSCDFYADPTHRNPLHSQTLVFLVEARGFVRVEPLFLHPAPEHALPLEEPAHPLLRRLKDWWFGPRDYAVIAYKPS